MKRANRIYPLSLRLARCACILVFLLTGQLCANAASELPSLLAVSLPSAPVWTNIFDDPLWQQATSQTLRAPSNVVFRTPPEETHVRVLWSKENLLVRFDCSDQSIVLLPGPEAAAGQRDLPYFKADVVEVFLDPVGDSRMYMEFQLAPNNGVFDAIYFCADTPQSGPDLMLLGSFVDRDLFTFPEWNSRPANSHAHLAGWQGLVGSHGLSGQGNTKATG
jgi:hypothetical protein